MEMRYGPNRIPYSGALIADGKKGEEIVLAFIRRSPMVLGVSDLRDIKEMRRADADCLIELWDGRVLLAEIKSDSHLGKSGNVLFEVLRINHIAPAYRAATLGWSAKTPAHWVFYFAPSVNSIYQVKFEDLRKSFQEFTANVRNFNPLECIRWVNTDSERSTVNILIPWSYCKDKFQIHRLGEEGGGPLIDAEAEGNGLPV